MAQTIVNDEGEEVVVLTQAEVDAQMAEKEAAMKAEFEKQLAEKDAHVKEKLGQFQQATKSAEQLHAEAMAGIAEAKRIAEEAKVSVAQSKESELLIKRDFYIQSIAGNDPDLKKKLEDSYSLINMPATTDAEIQERLQKAITLAGVTHASSHSMSFGGAVAPQANANSQQQRDAAHEEWKRSLNIKL